MITAVPCDNITTPPRSLIERLYHHAYTNPDRDAVVTPTLTLSYGQLAQLVREQVRAFNIAGIPNKAIIGIRCDNDTQHLVFCLAAAHIGATSCTIPSHEAEQTQSAVISHSGATRIIDEDMAADPSNLPDSKHPESKLQDNGLSIDNTELIVAEAPEPGSRLLFSTSGTTGKPKLVVHHDSDIVAQAHRHISSTQERFACLASMEHNFAKRHRLYCVAVGATNVFVNAERELLVGQCQSLKVNVMHVSAFQAQELLATPNIGKLSGIRLKLGGSHVPLSLRRQLRDNITNNLQAGYGTTETGAIAFTDPNDLAANESVGQPLPGIEIRAVTADRKPLGPGKRGELAVRCAGMFRGYLGQPELSNTRLDGGWFYAGDIGYLDNRQRIHLGGRSDDMFVFNSMNIYPQDIESEIRQYPGVIDAVVLPRKSSAHGHIPVALVVFDKNVKQKQSALKKFVRKRVGVRSPRQYIIVDEIPKNASGKISRRRAMDVPIKSSQIRSDIISILDQRIVSRLKPALVTAFKNGDEDISLREIGMDSLARMELLIALETEYDTVITPRELVEFRYLSNIVCRILSSPSKQPDRNTDPGGTCLASVANSAEKTAETQTDSPPYVVRFFQRIFSYCHTVAQLNKALDTLDHRLTPIDVDCLHTWHVNGQLIPLSAAEKFHNAISQWLDETKNLMLNSGKPQPEPFIARRIAPAITLFFRPGPTADKGLLICFPPTGIRDLRMPNAVFMQHTNSAQYDVLMISDPLNEGYRLGIPPFAETLTKTDEWLARQQWIRGYHRIRTLGFSAGGYPAVVAAYLLNAELAVSVGGRFHSKRYIIKNLDKMVTTWRAVRSGHCSRVLMSYAADNSRDRNYANIMAGIASANKVAIQFTNGKTGHLILRQLLARGELASYLQQTVFGPMNGPLISGGQQNMMMSFPAAKVLSH